jgi:hypothetical protein
MKAMMKATMMKARGVKAMMKARMKATTKATMIMVRFDYDCIIYVNF